MKLPTGKKKPIVIGGAVVGGLAVVWYVRKRNAAKTADTSTSNGLIDPNSVDPNTGLTYGQEEGGGVGGLGFGYVGSAVTQGGSATSGLGGTQYTSNTAWMSDALQAAQNYYGASYSLATSALGKYLAQNPKGLLDAEYNIVSEVVAQIGMPPVGGPYRLMHDNTPPPPSGGGNTTPPPSGGGNTTPPPPPPPPPPAPPANNGIPPGYHMQEPQYAVLPALMSLHRYWINHYGESNTTAADRLKQFNPNIGWDWTAHGDLSIKTSEAHLVPNF